MTNNVSDVAATPATPATPATLPDVAATFAAFALDFEQNKPTKSSGKTGESESVYANLMRHIAANMPTVGSMFVVTAELVAEKAPKVLSSVDKWSKKRSGIRDCIVNDFTDIALLHAASNQEKRTKAFAGGTGILLIRVPDETYAGTSDANDERGKAFFDQTVDALLAKAKTERAAKTATPAATPASK